MLGWLYLAGFLYGVKKGLSVVMVVSAPCLYSVAMLHVILMCVATRRFGGHIVDCWLGRICTACHFAGHKCSRYGFASSASRELW